LSSTSLSSNVPMMPSTAPSPSVALAALFSISSRADDETQLASRDDADVVQLHHVERVGDGDRDDRADLVDREDAVLLATSSGTDSSTSLLT
jgi:hypothetical protein